VESSDDAILGKTLDGIITSWNKGAEKIYGYLENEVIGQPISILVPTDREDETPQILGRLARGQAFNHYETVRRRKDGQEIQISLQNFLKKPFTLDVLASKVREMLDRPAA
jgi:PAS domain S-box-containing protein